MPPNTRVNPIAQNRLVHSKCRRHRELLKTAQALLSSDLVSLPDRHDEQDLDWFANYDGGHAPDDVIVQGWTTSNLTQCPIA
jgi:hypothetical protein